MSRQQKTRVSALGRRTFSAGLSWKRLLLYLLVAFVSASPFRAQKKISSGVDVLGRAGLRPESVYDSTVKTSAAAEEEKCLPWNLSGLRATTVNVTTLKVPPKARSEYEKACDASNRNKFAEAEQHARGAIGQFENYSAAWVMLGVILEEQQKAQEARDACAHAAAVDAKYLPAYLCAAEIFVRSREWEQVLDAAGLAAGLQSDGNFYAYYYRATAYLHLNNLAEARNSALRAVDMDVNHREPSLNLLLAKIYEREGDVANAIAELQQLLRRHTDRQQENAAKLMLVRLESQSPAE